MKKACLPSILLAVAAVMPSAHAQIATANIVGRVVDPSGAQVPNAAISATRAGTQQKFTTTSGPSGEFAILNLPFGSYELSVQASGFDTEVRSGLLLETGRSYRFDVQLRIGSIGTRVEVVADAVLPRTESPETGAAMPKELLEGIPQYDRHVINSFGILAPSVIPRRYTDPNNVNNVYINVRGQRSHDNNYFLDGAFLSMNRGELGWRPSPDALEEVEIKTGNYGAENGIRPGGQFIMVTKSGSNQFHGSVFEYLRNDNLEARSFFDRSKRPELRRNQFGAVIGGPLLIPKLFNGKDRAWFFFSYGGERMVNRQSLTGVVPTQDERAGRFASTVRDPLNGNQPFAGNVIPSARIHPAAARLLALYPDPNANAVGFNYVSPDAARTADLNQYIVKLDFQETALSRWYIRYTDENRATGNPNAIGIFQIATPYIHQSGAVSNVRTFRARFVNEFIASWLRNPRNTGDANVRPDFGRSLGIGGFPLRVPDFNGVPSVTATGLLALGDATLVGVDSYSSEEVRDSLGWRQGRHAIKLGYHWARYNQQQARPRRSAFNFIPRYTANVIGDMLLGYPASVRTSGDAPRNATYTNNHFVYFQDDWTIRPNVTINLGLRYEYRGPLFDRRGFGSNFDLGTGQIFPSLQPLALQPWETGRFEAYSPLFSFDNRAIQPRFGVAWRLNSRTVVRGGGGVYGNQPIMSIPEELGNNPRPNAEVITINANANSPSISLDNPFAATPATGASQPSLKGISRVMPDALVYHYGLTLQRQLSSAMVAEAAYHGSRGNHDYTLTEINDARPGTGNRQARRPYPNYQSIEFARGNASTAYDGFDLTLRMRPSAAGLTALVSYSFGRAFDYAGGRTGNPGDPRAVSGNLPLASNRGRGEAENRGRFVFAGACNLPVGRGRRWSPGGLPGALLGGWGLNAAFSWSAGGWVTPLDGFDRLDTGSTASQRPDALRNPNLPKNQRTVDRWFDGSAFAAPAPFTYGNAGRTIIQGPALLNLDASLTRTVHVGERLALIPRIEAFNATNHANFLNPGATFGTRQFGTITGALEGRSVQFGLKLQF